MSTITKERAELKAFITRFLSDPAHDNQSSRSLTAEVFRIALASLEAEAFGYVDAEYAELLKSGHIESCSVYAEQGEGGITLYTAPPAPLEIADLHRKAEIHDALCAKYNVESLADFVDWQRNHIAELEAAPPAPVGEGETAVMPDYPGYVMTQRECYQAGKKAGLAELVTTDYKLPDGWVACSERMPEREIDVQVYCSDKKEQMVGYMERNERDGYFRFASLPNGGGVYCQPTHWMPLSAAPQQEVKP